MADKKVVIGGSLGVIFGLCVFGMWASVIVAGLYGMFLAFSASIILGICCLFAPPLFPISGLLMFFFDFNLPMKILELITK